MKGYKGFEKGLICRGKQYTENTVFEEENAEICKSGMHFCKNPFDVWSFYPPCGKNGELNDFAEVEALDEVKTDDNMKFCTSKLRIGKKLAFTDFVNAGVKAILNDMESNTKTNTGDFSAATNTGNCSAATNTGNRSTATNTGKYSAATNTGNYSVATNTGYRSTATNTGNYSAATNTGYRSTATNTGDFSAATNTGDYSAATNTGDYSAATNTGNRSAATNTGDFSAATNTGYRSTATNTGEYSAATNTGCCSAATVEEKNSVAIVTGYGSKAKGVKGSWIVCTERDKNYNILCVKATEIDGEKIKENTFYTLKNGDFVESEEE